MELVELLSMAGIIVNEVTEHPKRTGVYLPFKRRTSPSDRYVGVVVRRGVRRRAIVGTVSANQRTL